MAQTVLIVENDPDQCEALRHVIEHKLNYKSVVALVGRATTDYILDSHHTAPDVMLLDLSSPDDQGMDVIREVLGVYPDLPIILLTMHGDMESATAGIRAGAADYLAKPVTTERLSVSIRNTLRMAALKREVERLKQGQQGLMTFSDLVGVSAAFKSAVQHAKDFAASDTSVVLQGERGVGKTSLAQAIRNASRRGSKPFITFDCRGLPEFPAPVFPLKESYEGTLFLKDIDLLSASLQERLVKELNGKSARLIASSKRSLEVLAVEGRFRRDLLARVQQVKIILPPLRERRDDIVPLAEHILKNYSLVEGLQASRFTSAATGLLISHSWSGNVRQLQQTIQRAGLFVTRDAIDISDFQNLLPAKTISERGVLSAFAHKTLTQPSADAPPILALVNGNGQMKPIEQVESEIIKFAINYYDGRMSEVARRLGIGRSTLYRKMQDLQIVGHDKAERFQVA